MFCSSCGQKNEDEARFCSQCGVAMGAVGNRRARPTGKPSGSGFPAWLIVLIVLILFAVPVVGILAAIAIPQYHEYTVRAKMNEVGAVGVLARTSVSRYLANKGRLPTDLKEAGFTLASRQVTSASLDGRTGAISLVIATPPYQGKILKYLPVSPDGKTIASWRCSADDIPVRHFPGSCR